MLSLFELLTHYGINPQKLGLVRHSNKEIDVLPTYKNHHDKFTTYTGWQPAGKYAGVDHLAVFAPYKGTSAMFLGIYCIEGCTPNQSLTQSHLDKLNEYGLPEEWFHRSDFYELKHVHIADDLSERLIIEWKSTVAWYQKKDKELIQIKAPFSLSDFESYETVKLLYPELKTLVSHPQSNPTWYSALSSINAIYLIQNTLDGKLYVGSAYGNQGLWGRWSNYVRTGHGDNKLLKPLNPDNFEFTILEIIPPTASAGDVIDKENRWKERLGTRLYGLNKN